MVDLPIILNLSEQIPALRRVRALDQLLMQDLPPLTVGTTLDCELRLCDGAGNILDESGTATDLRLVLSYLGDTGLVFLAEVDAFTPIAEDPKGWSFSLPLTAEALTTYLGTAGEAREAILDLTSDSGERLLYRRAVTLLPPVPATP